MTGPDTLRVVSLTRAGETYLWLYHPAREREALRSMGAAASNPELSFTWIEAAILAARVAGMRMREEAERTS